MTWTEEQIATIKRMKAQRKPARDIAAALNVGRAPDDQVTRNAVLGKVHRLGLSTTPKARSRKHGRVALHTRGAIEA